MQNRLKKPNHEGTEDLFGRYPVPVERGMAQDSWTSARGTVLRVAFVSAVVGAITFICFRLLPINATTVGFVYLVAILFIAAHWGLVEAIAGSVAADLCFNFFFFPPVGTFTVDDPQNWVALFAFLATAITASHLSTKARNRALEAQSRKSEMERLYALSRAILLIEPHGPVAQILAQKVAESFRASAVALYDGKTGAFHYTGPQDFPGLEAQFRQAAEQGVSFQNIVTGTVMVAIRFGVEPIGSLGICGVQLSDSALQSLASLVAIGLERARAQEATSRAEAARQSEELKSTLLDAIAHEFKTPLTTIKAATTSLLSDNPPKPERQRGFIAILDEEADRLSGLVTNAIQMARIEAGRIQLQRESCPVTELLAGVLETMKVALTERPVELSIPDGMPPLSADPELLALALRQLLDNAVKYSPAGAAVSVSAELCHDRIIVSVGDRGPGIPKTEQERVFHKFYRTRDSHIHVAGAGLGLSIARDIVRAHHGEIWIDGRPDGGSIFRVSLPVAAPGER